MRWLTFLLGAGLALTLQSAVAPRVAIFGARPDWLLVFVVFFALHARPFEAALGAWLIGFGADLMSIERLGLLSLTYLAAALMLLPIREYVFCARGSSQFVVTLGAGLVIRTAWLAYRGFLYGDWDGGLSGMFAHVALGALYTALWAPPVHKALLASARWLGISRPRYSHAGLERLSRSRV